MKTLLIAVAVAALPSRVEGQRDGRVATTKPLTAAADSAYATGNATLAESDYRVVLAADPNNSRALYMLAQLRVAEHPDEAAVLLRQYTRLVPRDAWGYIALGNALGRSGDVNAARAAFDSADRLAPRERDAELGRARMLARAGHVDEAISAYERRVATQPNDAESLRELGTQYRRAGKARSAIAAFEHAQTVAPDARTARQLVTLRAQIAPRIEPQSSGSRDSDANSVFAAGATAGFSVGDGVDLSLGGGTRRVTDGLDALSVHDARAAMAWAPLASTRIDLSAALAFAPDSATVVTPGQGQGRGSAASVGSSTTMIPSVRGRIVWRNPGGHGRLDLRASNALLDASPLLVRNHVQRSEAGVEGEVPLVGPFDLRASARAASFRSDVDDNTRMTAGLRLVAMLPGGGELSAGGQQFTHAHASAAGYFAPQQARTLDAGVYREFERESGLTFAVDLGAGAQQVADWGVPASAWSPAFRAWGAMGIPLAPGRELRFEVEAYDAKIGSDAALGAARWQYGSASVGLRWALR